jgi:hypothetical protein
MSRTMQRTVYGAVLVCAIVVSGCGDYAREGSGPAVASVALLEGASGAEPTRFGTTLSSDVLTLVEKDENGVKVKVPTIFSDSGRVTMTLTMKNPTGPAPTAMTDVTFNRYRVVYRRADGRNVPGVDVPHPIDSAATFTVRAGTNTTAGFEIVRHTAKQEPPLRTLLTNSSTLISTIADVTFYGQDRVGNDVSATGSMGITFGDFGDPD